MCVCVCVLCVCKREGRIKWGREGGGGMRRKKKKPTDNTHIENNIQRR